MRYFFHVHDTIDAIDDEGEEFPGVEAALAHATLCARELLADAARTGVIDMKHRIHVADASGALIDVVMFGDAVRVVTE